MKKIFEEEKTILEVLAEIYIFVVIILFPLIVNRYGYFRILECKWYSYLIISSLYVGVNILVILYYLVIKKFNIFGKIKLKIIHWLSLIYLLINIISCFTSPFFSKYNLFVGTGRGEGLIMTSLYVLSFLFVSLFCKFKKRYINYFVISSILLNIIAILQYIGFNPFNLYQNGIGTHNVSFMTTIGNIDFISALYCILLSISFCTYVFIDNNKKWENIIYIVSILMGFFIIGIINVQSGKLALLATLVIVFPFLISNNKRLSKSLVVLSVILLSYVINIIINPEYHYDIGSLNFYFQFNYIVILFLIVCSLLVYCSYKVKSLNYDFTSNKKIIIYIYLGIILCGLCGVLVLYFYNFSSGFLYEIHMLLHGKFDDEFGTYRVFLWKRTIMLIKDYPLLGSGPDTFAIRFMARFTDDIIKIGPLTINDTAANVYLTMIINIGIVGLTSYLTFIIYQIKEGTLRMNKYSCILLVAIVCFLIQDFFNLWVVIVTPIFWLLMAIHYISLNETIVKKRKKL